MFPKPKPVLVPNTYAFESEPMVKATAMLPDGRCPWFWFSWIW